MFFLQNKLIFSRKIKLMFGYIYEGDNAQKETATSKGSGLYKQFMERLMLLVASAIGAVAVPCRLFR